MRLLLLNTHFKMKQTSILFSILPRIQHNNSAFRKRLLILRVSCNTRISQSFKAAMVLWKFMLPSCFLSLVVLIKIKTKALFTFFFCQAWKVYLKSLELLKALFMVNSFKSLKVLTGTICKFFLLKKSLSTQFLT